jgi:hypothetical protein
MLDGQTNRHIFLYASTCHLLHYMAFLVIAVDTVNHLASVQHNISLHCIVISFFFAMFSDVCHVPLNVPSNLASYSSLLCCAFRFYVCMYIT